MTKMNPQWPDGPWDHEPDHVTAEHMGYPIIMHRNGIGAWCGYVGVPEGHPAFKMDYDGVHSAREFCPHGGYTYAAACQGKICHEKKDGEPERWWLGFDCAHYSDLVPGLRSFADSGEYRNQAYVMKECAGIIEDMVKWAAEKRA